MPCLRQAEKQNRNLDGEPTTQYRERSDLVLDEHTLEMGAKTRSLHSPYCVADYGVTESL